MAYDQNKLSRIAGLFDGSWNGWVYRSADPFATVKAPNFIANAQEMGIKARDKIIVVDTLTPATTIASILTVTATTCTISQTGLVIVE